MQKNLLIGSPGAYSSTHYKSLANQSTITRPRSGVLNTVTYESLQQHNITTNSNNQDKFGRFWTNSKTACNSYKNILKI